MVMATVKGRRSDNKSWIILRQQDRIRRLERQRQEAFEHGKNVGRDEAMAEVRRTVRIRSTARRLDLPVDVVASFVGLHGEDAVTDEAVQAYAASLAASLTGNGAPDEAESSDAAEQEEPSDAV